MASLAFDADIARSLFESLDQIHLVYIHPNGVGVHGRDFGERVEEALADAAKANTNGFNIYWTVKRIDILAHLEEAGMIRVMEMAKGEGARGPARRVYFDVA